MNDRKRIALRAAASIRSSLVERQARGPKLALPETAWSECVRLVRHVEKADMHGWHLAARQMREQLAHAAALCRGRVEQFERECEMGRHQEAVPTQRQLFLDLIALEDEFDEIHYNLKRRGLSVVTEAIALEGVELGRFEIELDLDDWGSYEVISMDPNPAASSSETTHPHVQDNRLCEGEGRVPIRRALAQGRMIDFFLLVRQILQTYNPGSAYLSLDQWYGIECRDCGRLINEDERACCERCEEDVCYDCSSGCDSCGRSCCSGCVQKCAGCEEWFCEACLETCVDCVEMFCQECLTDDRCPSCRDNNKNDKEKNEEADERAHGVPPEAQRPHGPPLQPLRLGEAAAPA
jgi:hypothetical protein